MAVQPPDPRSYVVSFEGQLSTVHIRASLFKCGRILSCNPSKPGTILVKLVPNSPEAAISIVSIKSIGDKAVTIAPFHRTSSGTVFFREFTTWSDTEIQEELGSAASLVKRLATRDGASERSGRLHLEFPVEELPENVTLACGVILSVRQFTPAPLRCGRCHYFGHHQDTCSNGARCGRCGATTHSREACPAPVPCCPSCKGPHEIDARNCPAWAREREIKKIRLSRGISTSAARTVYKAVAVAARRPPAATRQPQPRPQQLPLAPAFVPVAGGPANATSWASITAGYPPVPQPRRSIQPQPLQQQAAAAPSALVNDDRIIALMEKQTEMLLEITKQNSAILSMLSALMLNGQQRAPTSPSTSSGPRKRLRREEPSPAKKSTPPPRLPSPKDTTVPAAAEGVSTRSKAAKQLTIYNLGRDYVGSPSADNIGTFDFREKEE